jgi:hypothetical protein
VDVSQPVYDPLSATVSGFLCGIFSDVKMPLSDVSPIAKTGVLFVFRYLWSIRTLIGHPKAAKSDLISPT